MSQRMALIHSDLCTNYYTSPKKTPELRLEADIVDLFNQNQQLPDDMKVKLLGRLIIRYEKVTHQHPEPVGVTLSDDKSTNIEGKNAAMNYVSDPILNDILTSVPSTFTKFVPTIVDKLKTQIYLWNELGGLTYNNIPFRGSKIVDLFSNLMRNISKRRPPEYFDEFLQALKEINIPISWIANQLVLSRMKGTSHKKESGYFDSKASSKNQSEEEKLKNKLKF